MNMHINNGDIDDVLQVVKHKYGYDFSNYARASLHRRIEKFMLDNKIKSVYDLKFDLLNNKGSFDLFLQTVTVNVTEIFRDPAFYKTLAKEVLPVLASYPIIKIWHAGCSTGEEVYSMCILLEEAGLLNRARVYATDINPVNVQKAKAGFLSLQNMKEYTANYIQSGGQKDFSDYYTARYNQVLLRRHLLKNVVFSQHNLVTDSVFNEFQLVLCRNVMIYFDKDLQNRVLKLFYESLSPLGFLALGMKESLLFSEVKDKFEVVNKTVKIFRRKD